MERKADRIEHPIEFGANEQVQRKRVVLHSDDFAAQSPFLRLSEDWFAAPGGFEECSRRRALPALQGSIMSFRNCCAGDT